jgi:GDSL-like Lipase/Acylhydrolase family
MARTSLATYQQNEPQAGHRPREWRPRHLAWLAIAAVFLFCVVFWAALGKPPLSGMKIVAALGVGFIALANVSFGALVAGAGIEFRHRDWSRLHGIDHVFIAVALAAMLAVEAGFAWWLFTSDTRGGARWLFLAVALAGIGVGAVLAWPALFTPTRPSDSKTSWALWPQHADAARGEEWRMLNPLTALVGAALGVVVAVGCLGISAWHENTIDPAGHALPAAVTGIQGGYVALGDSYSAGEGLEPFAPGTAVTACDRSVGSAYPDLLYKLLRASDHQASFSFNACSGAVIGGIFKPTQRALLVPPQVDGTVQPSVGLVTLTIGGNNAIFSKVVMTCVISGDCLEKTFPPPGVNEATAVHIPPGAMLTRWGPATIEQIGKQDTALFAALRHDFPNARIVVIGYPYLFPSQPAPGFPFVPPECASILNRLSAHERAGIRTLQDEFNNRTYEAAAISGVEFVSPVAIWDGHEPCGSGGQYTNSVKPYLNFSNPINGGSFHPNAGGQRTLAALLGCYLDANPQPPDPFMPGAPHIHALPPRLVTPSQLGMVAPPGLDSVPGTGTIPHYGP